MKYLKTYENIDKVDIISDLFIYFSDIFNCKFHKYEYKTLHNKNRTILTIILPNVNGLFYKSSDYNVNITPKMDNVIEELINGVIKSREYSNISINLMQMQVYVTDNELKGGYIIDNCAMDTKTDKKMLKYIIIKSIEKRICELSNWKNTYVENPLNVEVKLVIDE